MSRARFAPTLSALVLAGGCSFILDFDNIEGLPCPCDPDHVCLVPSQTCFRRHSVDDFKSCDIGAATPDDLCRQNSICQSVNGDGPKCLPTCTPSTYATPESSQNIGKQCPEGTTCWLTDRGGVCSGGVCNEIPNDCPPPKECVRFNGAGVCFTPCAIFQLNPPPCANGQVCHPVGTTGKTQCIDPGPRKLGEPCSDTDMCEQTDMGGRRLACEVPSGSKEIRRCRAICICPPDGSACSASGCNSMAACAIAVPDADITTHAGLGVCLE
jgi:hypothetical protein